MSTIRRRSLWPSDLFMATDDQHHEHAPALLQDALHRAAAAEGRSTSQIAPDAKQGLFESRFDVLADGAHPGVRTFLDGVLERVTAIHGGPGSRLRLVEAWVHVTRPGGYHDHHRHGDVDWSGIYCVASGAPAGEGAINRWYQPFHTRREATAFDVRLEDGQAVVFPAHLAHAGLPHPGPGTRVILAFNAVFAGPELADQ